MAHRFWQYINGGYVKISIEEGQELSWGYREYHEEGFNEQYFQWYGAKGGVSMSRYYRGRDCDGLIESSEDLYSSKLKEVESEEGYMLPKWENLNNRHRDYTAESMGY